MKIICAFSCTGKTETVNRLKQKGYRVIELDEERFKKSTETLVDLSDDFDGFKMIEDIITFPDNFINRLKLLAEDSSLDYLILNATLEVLDILVTLGLEYTLIYPHTILKEAYIGRAFLCGYTSLRLKILNANWEYFISSFELDKHAKEKVELRLNEYLLDVFDEWE